MAHVNDLEIAVKAEEMNRDVVIDSMNKTRLFVNDCEIEPDENSVVAIPEFQIGDRVELTTRSSEWSGVVVDKRFGDAIIRGSADGVFDSITNGISGLIDWQIGYNNNFATVETSLFPRPVPYYVYLHTKIAANSAVANIGDRDRIWSQMLAVAMKVASAPPVPENWYTPQQKIDFGNLSDLSDEDEVLLGSSVLDKVRGE